MANFNNSEELLNNQYHSAEHLNTRISLHQRFSTNKQGFSNWIFEHYTLKPHQYVLELGCGNGGIWKSHAADVPEGAKVLLSDFSEGMLAEAKENLKELDFVRYKVIDAQKVPSDDNLFDIVIANHVLPFVPDVKKALGEISRVLKPDGIFYASTNGRNNLAELTALLRGFDPSINFATEAFAQAFGLETGREQLEAFFGAVEMDRYIDGLHITEVRPLVDYVLSLHGIGNVNEIITGDRVGEFTDYLSGVMAGKGYIDIRKDAGLFISGRPVKQNTVSAK